MTTPTQAQIEAVKCLDDIIRSARQAYCALTAAAQVGEDDISEDWKRGYEAAMKSAAETYRNQLAAAITEDREHHIKNEVALVERAIEHTIERCVQVADGFKRLEPRQAIIAAEIATAIRALKDKP
jgi:hypothetical protein